MKVTISSMILASCMIFLPGCEALRMGGGVGGSSNAPSPKTPPGADTAVSYHHQKGAWHQLRLTLEADGPDNAEKDRWKFDFKSKVSVWRFNPESGEYDIPLASGSPSAYWNTLFSYFGDGGDDTFSMVTPSADVHWSGNAGLPDGDRATVMLDIEPKRDEAGLVVIDGETTLSVTSWLTISSSNREKRWGAVAKTAQVKREWKVTPQPGRQATFEEVFR